MNDDLIGHPIFEEAGILLVDDDPDFLETLKAFFEDAGFSRVYAANDGLDALSILMSDYSQIDLVSLDLKMPRMDGMKLAATIANQFPRIIGLVVLSGYGTRENREAFATVGSMTTVAAGFVDKPCSLESYLSVCADALRNVLSKREKQGDLHLKVALERMQKTFDCQSKELAALHMGVGQLGSDIGALGTKLDLLVSSEKARAGSDLNYVWALAGLFFLVAGGLAWASFYLPILSVLAAAATALVVLMLIAVFDLSKGDKLSEKSLMEVVRRAFSFLRKK
jgi:CheY-like chemotaxis protein